MLLILPTEGSEELTGFELQAPRERSGLHKRFLQFDLRFVFVVEFQDDVGEPFEIRVNCAIQRQLGIAQ